MILLVLAGCDGVFGLATVHPPPDAPPDAPPPDALPPSVIGCADGTREGFTDMVTYPGIAGCDGAWTIGGVIMPRAPGPNCATSGNDGGNGVGCSIANLCGPGWSVCPTPLAVGQRTTGDGCNAVAYPQDSFYVTRVSGGGGRLCDGLGSNDLFGCGTAGSSPDGVSCAPLNVWSGDLCNLLTVGGWSCGADQFSEAMVVTKSEVTPGGALCCKDML